METDDKLEQARQCEARGEYVVAARLYSDLKAYYDADRCWLMHDECFALSEKHRDERPD
jgi:hypothetical protein